MSANNSSPGTPSPPESQKQSSPVSNGWIALLGLWFVLLTGFFGYGLIEFWPPPSLETSLSAPIATPAPNESAGQSSSPTSQSPASASARDERKEVAFLWKPRVTDEERLFILILFAGALGSMVYVLRSFSWYVGQKALDWSWVPKYMLRPAVGAALAVVFYLVIRGGFAQSVSTANSFSYVALASIIGLFSSEAAEKLKTIAETIFQDAPKGNDQAGGQAAGQPPPGDQAPEGDQEPPLAQAPAAGQGDQGAHQ
jgi:hypothetical protein